MTGGWPDTDPGATSRDCTKCGDHKPLTEFYRQRRGRYGRMAWCKICMGRAKEEWVKNNKEQKVARDKIWRDNNPEKVAAYRLKTNYNLSVAQRAEMGDVCWVCGDSADVVIDHDHSCCAGERSCGGCVRGLLCRKCNLAIGHFGDDIEKLVSAIYYLEVFEC